MKACVMGLAVLLAACGSMNNGGSGGGGGGTGGGGGAPDAGGGAPTFTAIYSEIISSRCSPCHTAAGGIGISEGHLDMTSQSAAYANLVGVAGDGIACMGKGTRVVPGMPDSSLLYLKVSLDDPSPCGAKMPLTGAPLTQAQVDQIKTWITAGATNGG